MSNASVSTIRLPGFSSRWPGQGIARSALLRALGQIQCGSLTIHEREQTLHFGDAQDSAGPHAVVNVNDPLIYRHVLTGGSVGAGESYMLGHWSSPQLVDVIRLLCANMAAMDALEAGASWPRRMAMKLLHAINSNTMKGSHRNISAHYDLGNDFFSLFLDREMMYSSAVYPAADAGLEQAATHKLDLLCRQLELGPEDHLLEIGTGWGGMAVHAAKNYGCRVTTTTISQEQYEYACDRVEQEGLAGQVTVLCRDYRDLEGSFDKLVSVEMIEAVGHDFYQNYFSKCSGLLKPGGLMAIQAITVADQRYTAARDSVDFIKRYIFPGGCLPSVEVISRHLARDTDMQIVHLRDITADYAQTLAHWRERFQVALPQVREQGFDQTFERMWEFYLCYCEGGFHERVIGTVQLTFAKPGYRFER
jgi:cyclopropane-fatty-acyl-phospholipid synthase